MKKVLQNNIQGKKVLLLFISTNIVYALMLLVTIPKVMSFSKGMKLLDMMPTGYTTDYVQDLLEALGTNGRDAYLYNQLPVDMIYPLLFGIGYCLVLAYFLNKLNSLKTPFVYLCFLPILAGIADYLENFGIISLLTQYPEISDTMVAMTNGFSLIKSISTSIYFVVLLVVLATLGLKTLKKG